MSFHTLKSSGSSLKNIQYGIDAVAHNLANMNTTGFKKTQVNYEAVVNSHGVKGDGLSGTALNSSSTVFSQGGLKSTGQYTDLAIQGEGFFSLQNASGEVVYSRAGHFLPDSEGNLVDAQGSYLLNVSGGRVNIPVDAYRVEINVQGEVNVAYDDIAGLQYYDQIQLATFPNPTGLERIGGNYYREGVASGIPEFSTAGQAASRTHNAVILSGALELANTNISESMTDMMSFQRSYQAVAQTSTAADEILQTTINLAN